MRLYLARLGQSRETFPTRHPATYKKADFPSPNSHSNLLPPAHSSSWSSYSLCAELTTVSVLLTSPTPFKMFITAGCRPKWITLYKRVSRKYTTKVFSFSYFPIKFSKFGLQNIKFHVRLYVKMYTSKQEH